MPRDEFVRNLSGRSAESWKPRAWSRVAFACALTALLVGMFASFGGLGYAATGATQAIGTLTKLKATYKVKVHSAADDQYKPAPQKPKPAARGVAHANPAGVGVAAATQSRTLPFTGLSLLGTVLISLTLIAIGIALRRRERRSS